MSKFQSKEQIIPSKGSELSGFVEHTLPPESDVERFDEYLKEPARRSSVSESLSKIYEDDSGQRVNVKEMNIKRRRSIFARFGLAALYVIIGIGVLGGAYYWLLNHGNDVTAFDFNASAPAGLKTNQEFSYTLDYRNRDTTAVTTVEVVAVYPENFIFVSSQPAPSEGNNKWRLPDLAAHAGGQIKITGRLIGQPGQSNIMFSDLTYRPAGITSTFKKSSSIDTVLASSGITIEATAPGSALVGQDETVTLTFSPENKNYLDHFLIRLEKNQNIVLGKSDLPEGISSEETGVWSVDTSKPSKPLAIKFKFKDRLADSESLKLSFEYAATKSNQSFRFDEKTFSIEVIKNTLNLTISANDTSADQGANFGQPISYSISYANKGEITMNDVIIRAVFSGDALDWRNISDEHKGKVSGSTVIWTKNEIPELRALLKGQEGTINFTVPVRGFNEAKLITSNQISAYAQFALGEKPEDLSLDNDSNRSNQLLVKINSDISLDESLRYFDTDNIAVGTGPLPPQVGLPTTVKVYWKLTNTLHEVGDVKVTTVLPSYVSWDAKNLTATGTISYDKATNSVSWNVGRMPLSVAELTAEFSISVQPRPSDRNKLLVMVSGTTLTGVDSQTSYPVTQKLKSQTTQLEKDDIANSDGIIR